MCSFLFPWRSSFSISSRVPQVTKETVVVRGFRHPQTLRPARCFKVIAVVHLSTSHWVGGSTWGGHGWWILKQKWVGGLVSRKVPPPPGSQSVNTLGLNPVKETPRPGVFLAGGDPILAWGLASQHLFFPSQELQLGCWLPPWDKSAEIKFSPSQRSQAGPREKKTCTKC